MLAQSRNPEIQSDDDNNKNDSHSNEISKLKLILQKPSQIRSGTQNLYLTNFIRQNIGLSKLAEEISFQFVRNLLKTARIVNLPKKSIICEKGSKIDQMGIVISGQLAILNSNQQQNAPFLDISYEEMFDKLLQKAKILGKQLRKKQSNANLNVLKTKQTQAVQKQYKQIQNLELTDIQNIQSYINQSEFFGFKDRSMSQVYLKNCVCLNDETNLLVFQENNLMVNLELAFKQKLKKMTGILRQISCFNFLDIDKLNLIIQNMVVRRKRKGQYVYKQGEEAGYFYLLIQGQIKITKQTSLFLENPNILYGDRKRLVYESLTTNKKQSDKVQKIFINKQINKSLLPYANLTTLYNYRPMKKLMQIGVFTPPCLFGEEQYCQKNQRDTNTMCTSLSIQYYQIKLSKLEQIIGVKSLGLFKNQVRNLVRKKILYRQSQYANSINLQNNSNLNYFYLEEGKQKQSPRNFKISKFNNKIQQKKQAIQKNSTQETNSPAYTTFNFHKMKSHGKINKSNNQSKLQDFEKSFQQNYSNPTQMKIMQMTHTWKLLKQKVDMSQKASKKISPFRPTINLNKPLIASEYFFNVQRQSKRIQRQHRKRIASLSKSFRTSRASQKQQPQGY